MKQLCVVDLAIGRVGMLTICVVNPKTVWRSKHWWSGRGVCEFPNTGCDAAVAVVQVEAWTGLVTS